MTDVHQSPQLARAPGGPIGLDWIVRHDDDGLPVTAEEHILSRLRMGAFLHEALEGAHVRPSVYYDWIRKGSEAETKQAEGRKVNVNERRYIQFGRDVARANDEARTRVIGTIVGMAIGGLQQTTVTRKERVDGDGHPVTETTTKTETLAPNVQAATWLAERRWAKDWNRREQVELSGPDGGPIKVASAIAALDQELEQTARRKQAAIAVTSTESDPLDVT